MNNFKFNRLLPRYVGNFDIRKLIPGLFGQTLDMSGLSGLILPTGQIIQNPILNTGQLAFTPVAMNATGTLTVAQVAAGYITSTSASPVTMTLPTGTLLGAALGATQGTVFDLYIDNTAGANTVTMAVATNGIKSDAANTTAASFGQLTVASGITGVGRFTLMFSSATAYVFTRTA